MRARTALLVVLVALGALGAGYVWATAFGDGLHGLKDSAALDRSDSFPDANVAFIAALVACGAGPFGVAYLANVRGRLLLHWFAGLAVAGGAVFGLSRLLP